MNYKLTEFELNKRCAEIMDLNWNVSAVDEDTVMVDACEFYDPCTNPADCWPIIERCWEYLNEVIMRQGGKRRTCWQDIMKKHKCTKLQAACICLVECYG